jgi:hypothetical protein
VACPNASSRVWHNKPSGPESSKTIGFTRRFLQALAERADDSTSARRQDYERNPPPVANLLPSRRRLPAATDRAWRSRQRGECLAAAAGARQAPVRPPPPLVLRGARLRNATAPVSRPASQVETSSLCLQANPRLRWSHFMRLPSALKRSFSVCTVSAFLSRTGLSQAVERRRRPKRPPTKTAADCTHRIAGYSAGWLK